MALLAIFEACILIITVTAAATWMVTNLQFRAAVKKANHATKDKTSSPPTIPYLFPGLGSTLSFSTQKVGSFWQSLLLTCHQNKLDAASIVLNGAKTHFIFSAAGVQSLFKARELSRFRLDQQLGRNVLGMSKTEATKAFPSDLDPRQSLTTERIHSDMLLSTAAVNSMTSKFMQVFSNRVLGTRTMVEEMEVDLYEWMREQLFHASTTALCGEKMIQLIPNLAADFWKWDEGLIGMLFGTPRLFARQAYNARDKLLDGLERWLAAGYAAGEAEGNPDWEPNFGARVMRKRHEFYSQQDLSLRTQAGFDLIFLGGILSNAIPATGWVLMHLLSPSSPEKLLENVMYELKSAQLEDDSVDIPTLVTLPLLNAVFHDVLRLYTDLLVVRQVDADVALDKHAVRRGEMTMAPSWMAHRNPAYFENPSDFDPGRFLQTDERTGKLVYNTSGLGGKCFPFGGGHYMCPGRTFAKQEILGAVAVLLLNFDVEFLGFVKDCQGDSGEPGASAGFPKMKKGLAGNVVVGLDCDMRVRMTRKQQGNAKIRKSGT